ncbi:NADPH-dependent FMN reductase [Paenibacillus rigui]|uniref:Flavoprotein n=1 Tax=Paenibacillus rigui TaxID=554312 RepID=A0A229UJS4_9BACL|nr:NADPH-dependent FMN reductase [Paenibacillus rigui]OXM83660.1 flavoprotein [Paenibacillus rigui]
MNKKKILAVSGSLRQQSSNTAILQAAARIGYDRFEFTMYNGMGTLPHFNPEMDLEGDAEPAPVKELRSLLRAADGVLICTPEYANGVPGSLKNALDWIVSSGEFYDKPTAAISASPNPLGGDKAHASLLLTLKMLTAKIAEGATLMIPMVSKKLNAAGDVTDLQTLQALEALLYALEREIDDNTKTSPN